MARFWLVVVALLAALVVPADAPAAPPDNDAFANARTLISGVGTTGSTAEATLEAGEPWHSTAGSGPGGSVWFRWSADATGTVRIDACGSGFDTEVAVYGGATMDSTLYSTRIADDAGGCSARDAGSYVVFRATAGNEYRIVLAGWSASDEGDYSLVVNPSGSTTAAPANDTVAGAPALSGASPDATGTNVDATNGWNEWPAIGTQSVWWTWVSPVDGQAQVDTCASGFDTRLAVMRDSEFGLVGEASSEDGCGDRSSLTFNAVKGRKYSIAVGGNQGAAGPIALRIRAGTDITAPATTFTRFPDAVDGHRIATFEWEVSEHPYTVECSLDGGAYGFCDGTLYGLAEGDHVYRIRASDQYGNVEDPPTRYGWRIEQPTPPNDDFADAMPLVRDQAVTVNNGRATAEAGEPGHHPYYGTSGTPAHSVWFRFTAVGGLATFDLCGVDWHAVWALYTGSGLGSLTKFAGGYTDLGCKPSMYVTPGNTYYLAVDGESSWADLGTGPIPLTPSGDAIPVAGEPASAPGAPSPGGEPADVVTKPPEPGVVVELARTTRLRADRRLRVPGAVRCGEVRCTVTVRVERSKKVVLARLSASVPAHTSRRFTLRVSRPARRKICRAKRAMMRVSATGGSTTVQRQTRVICR